MSSSRPQPPSFAPDQPRRVALTVRFPADSADAFVESYWRGAMSGGILISTSSSPPLSLGETVRFRFNLQSGADILSGEGIVAWLSKGESGEPGIGLRFVRLTPGSADVHRRLMIRKSHELKRQLVAKQRHVDQTAASLSSGEFRQRAATRPVAARIGIPVRDEEDITLPYFAGETMTPAPPPPRRSSKRTTGAVATAARGSAPKTARRPRRGPPPLPPRRRARPPVSWSIDPTSKHLLPDAAKDKLRSN